jgi:hypothetical protein
MLIISIYERERKREVELCDKEERGESRRVEMGESLSLSLGGEVSLLIQIRINFRDWVMQHIT